MTQQVRKDDVMLIISIDLEQISDDAIYAIAKSSTEEETLKTIFAWGMKQGDRKRKETVFISLACNHSPAIKDTLEKVCENSTLFLRHQEFDRNPYLPNWVLKQIVATFDSEQALYNPGMSSELLNANFEKRILHDEYICKRVMEINGDKLSKEALQMIINEYPDKIIQQGSEQRVVPSHLKERAMELLSRNYN